MGNTVVFNGEMVIVARESRGLRQSELAEKIGISSAQLSRLELGLRDLREPLLQRKLEEVLGYPAAFFTQRQLVYGLGVSEVFHRKRKSVTDRVLNKAYARIYLRTTEIGKLLRNVNIGDTDIRPIDIDAFDNDASEIARMVRASWHLQHGPIRNLVEVIENAGGIVIPFDFETTTIDAISHWPQGMPPLFFVNRFSPMDRLRFTLCHELGHIIMHRTVDPESENQADAFASEFLMPKRDIRPQLADLSLLKLASLKPLWRVSMAALLKRATDLEQITPRQARALWMQLGKFGYRTREAIDIAPEVPALLTKIIDTHLDEMCYSVSELSEALCLSDGEMRDTYIDPRQHIIGQERQSTLKEDKKAAIREVERIFKNGTQDAIK